MSRDLALQIPHTTTILPFHLNVDPQVSGCCAQRSISPGGAGVLSALAMPNGEPINSRKSVRCAPGGLVLRPDFGYVDIRFCRR